MAIALIAMAVTLALAGSAVVQPSKLLIHNPFDTLNYETSSLVCLDSARCSDFATREKHLKVLQIEIGQKLDSCLIKRATLNSRAIRRVMNILNDPSTYVYGPVSCYNPRVAIVFFDSSEMIVGYILICMDCDKIRSDPEIPANYNHRVIDSTTGEELYRLDFSTSAKKMIWRFLKEHGVFAPLDLRGSK